MPSVVSGAPARDLRRSPASLRVARLASESGLFFAHFEHRFHWTAGAGNLTETPRFTAGILPEPKYQSFRHDLLVASFHPGHRAKWTSHELCHGLVGFAYEPGGTRLFHALAAWLAELLPVTLWYFWDEAGARTCAHHPTGSPIFQQQCEACEVAARRGPRKLDRDDRDRMRAGRTFLDRELAAIARSKRLGRPLGGVHASIDLASDGLAYAASHADRLGSETMERYVSAFFGPDQGHHASLEALEARVEAVAKAVADEKPLAPHAATRWDYVAQDVGYRLLTLAERQPSLAAELGPLIDGLAAQRTARGVARTIAAYEDLWRARPKKHAAAWLSPASLFAVGYGLPGGHGSALSQLAEGIASACPNTFEALGRDAEDIVRAFAADDRPERQPIGRRFAAFLARHEPTPLAELARVEAAITHVRPRDALAVQLAPSEGRGERVALARGVEVVEVEHDVLGTKAARLRRLKSRGEARCLIVARAEAGEVDVMELPQGTAEQLRRAGERGVARGMLGLTASAIEELLEARILVPVAYAL